MAKYVVLFDKTSDNSDNLAGKVTAVGNSYVTVDTDGLEESYTYKGGKLDKGDVVVFTTKEKDDEVLLLIVSKLIVDDSKLQYITEADGRRALLDGESINLDRKATADKYEDYMVVFVEMDENEVDSVSTGKYDDVSFADFDRVYFDDDEDIMYIITGMDERTTTPATSGDTPSTSGDEELPDVSMTVVLNGQELEEEGTYEVKGGDKVIVTAQSNTGSTIAFIGYYFLEDGFETIKDVMSDSTTITLPALAAGSKRTLDIEAVGANNQGENDNSNRTKWQRFYLKWVEESGDNEEPEILRGDVNGDNKVTLLDVRLAILKVVNNEYTPDEIEVLDYNEDGRVSLIDVRLLLLDVVNKK